MTEANTEIAMLPNKSRVAASSVITAGEPASAQTNESILAGLPSSDFPHRPSLHAGTRGRNHSHSTLLLVISAPLHSKLRARPQPMPAPTACPSAGVPAAKHVRPLGGRGGGRDDAGGCGVAEK